MPVVSNTSPLCNLAIIDRLEILRRQFGVLALPSGVQLELDRLSHAAARARLTAAFRDGWLQVTPLAIAIPSALAATLDPGETEALALALQMNASLVLLDETAARLQATRLGLAHAGVLGILRGQKYPEKSPRSRMKPANSGPKPGSSSAPPWKRNSWPRSANKWLPELRSAAETPFRVRCGKGRGGRASHIGEEATSSPGGFRRVQVLPLTAVTR